MSQPDLTKYTDEQLVSIIRGQQPGTLRPVEAAPLPEPVSPLVRIGQGMSDIYGGAKQKYLNFTDPQAAAQYTKQGAEDEALIARGRAAYGEGGFDPLRMVGSVATPLSAIPMGGASAMTRAGIGALVGGAGGYTSFDPTNTTVSNLTNTAVGAVGGGALNAAVPPLVSALVSGAQTIKNTAGQAWRAFTQKVSPSVANNITQQVSVTLQNAGVDLAALPAAIRQSVLDDAASQFTSTGKLDPEMLLRRSDINAVGGQGSATRAQITRDPADWTNAQNLQKTEVNIPAVQRGDQPTLTGRFQQQNASTNRYAQELQDKIGGTAPTQTQASEQAIKAVQARDAASKVAVDNLYNEFRALGKGDVAVPDGNIAATLGNIVDEIGVENINKSVMARLREFGFLEGTRTKLLTVTEADKLGRMIGSNNPGFGVESMVATRLKRAVDSAILEIPEIDASKALIKARDVAKLRFDEQKAGLGVSRAIADVAPDRFFQQNILGGNTRDIIALRDQLAKTADGAEAWNSIRGQVVQFIRDQSTSTNGVFSGARMNDAMKRIGQDRLAQIFSPQELAQVQTLLRGSKAMTLEPAFAAPNRSNTTPSLMGALLRLGNKIPVVNLATGPIEREVAASAKQTALINALQGGGVTAGRDSADAASRAALVKLLTEDRAFNPAMLPTAIQEQYRPR